MSANSYYMKNSPLLLFFFIFLIYAVQNSIAQSPTPKIHPNDLLSSTEFKASQGKLRFNAFEKLENLIKPASSFDGPAPDYEYYLGDYKMSSTDLVFLLGEPDLKIAPSIWQYNLKPSTSCRVVIGIDEDLMVSYLVVRDCF